MAKAAVGLFSSESVAVRIMHELEAAGIASSHLHVLAKPRYMPVTGVLSTPVISFSAAFLRDLGAIGATEAEAQAYLDGVLDGGALVIADGPTDQIERCADIMNRNHATKVEEMTGTPVSFTVMSENADFPASSTFGRPGKVSASQGGVRIFTW